MSFYGSYGILKTATIGVGEAARIAEEVKFRGFSVARNVIERQQVDDFCQFLDSVYEVQCHEVGGTELLEAIQDSDIVRCPLVYDARFLSLATHPLIVDVAKQLLGDSLVLLMQNGIINRPDQLQVQTRWHRDLNYQHWTSSKPLAISALACLEDFNEQTGATTFLPASHKFEDFPPPEMITTCEVIVDAPKGSILFFDAMAFHRAGRNKSNRIRRAINHVIGVPILAQQIDIPAMLKSHAPTDPWLAGYLGYRWNPTASVKAWRLKKHDQRSVSES